MVNIDSIFLDPIIGGLLLPGFPAYWEDHRKGIFLVDQRLAYRFTNTIMASFIVKNCFNKEYMGRPGDIRPPRNFTLRISMNF